jgi:hypothetical protein
MESVGLSSVFTFNPALGTTISFLFGYIPGVFSGSYGTIEGFVYTHYFNGFPIILNTYKVTYHIHSQSSSSIGLLSLESVGLSSGGCCGFTTGCGGGGGSSADNNTMTTPNRMRIISQMITMNQVISRV